MIHVMSGHTTVEYAARLGLHNNPKCGMVSTNDPVCPAVLAHWEEPPNNAYRSFYMNRSKWVLGANQRIFGKNKGIRSRIFQSFIFFMIWQETSSGHAPEHISKVS